MPSLEEYAEEIVETNKANGWHDEENQKSFPEDIAMCHTELSEALESWRKGEKGFLVRIDKNGNGKPDGWEVELVDEIIRCLDVLKTHGSHNIDELLKEKLKYNKTRGYLHGNRKV